MDVVLFERAPGVQGQQPVEFIAREGLFWCIEIDPRDHPPLEIRCIARGVLGGHGGGADQHKQEHGQQRTHVPQ